jgi:hypothetical protein
MNPTKKVVVSDVNWTEVFKILFKSECDW